MRRILRIGLVIAVISIPTAATDTVITRRLLGDFPPGWEREWERRILANRANVHRVILEHGNGILEMDSYSSASGFWRKWEIDPVGSGTISWRWKVRTSLLENLQERKKAGDDYAARVFVIFEPHFLSWKTKAICYAWAGQQPVGSVYPSPYGDSVGMVILQSGNKNAEKWITQRRNFIEDYVTYFRKHPAKVSGVAVMVDTDNTKARAMTWFDDLTLQYQVPAAK
jgi:hypothetical protein